MLHYLSGVLFAIILLMFEWICILFSIIIKILLQFNNMTAKYQYILNTPRISYLAIEQAFQTIPQEFRDSFLSLIDDQYDDV